MFIKTKDGYRRLWDITPPSIAEVRERIVWLGPVTSPKHQSERIDFERAQHKLLLDLRAGR